MKFDAQPQEVDRFRENRWISLRRSAKEPLNRLALAIFILALGKMENLVTIHDEIENLVFLQMTFDSQPRVVDRFLENRWISLHRSAGEPSCRSALVIFILAPGKMENLPTLRVALESPVSLQMKLNARCF